MTDKYNDKQIAVIGFGIEGESVIKFLLSHNPRKISVLDEKERSSFDEVTLNSYEERGVEFIFGKIASLKGWDVAFRSPGLNPELPLFIEAREFGIEVTSATKAFFDLCPCPIIGVTGTKGKGTTSTLIYEMLKKEGKDAYLGGNIGIPPLSFISKLTKNSQVVLELSSFQLMDLHKSPHIAVMLMITSEHLDYHKDEYEYVEAKRNIVRFQSVGDFTVLNKDYLASRETDIYTDGAVYYISREQDIEKGCFVKNNKIMLRVNDSEQEVLDTKGIALKGKHNWENVCAAIMAARLGGAKMEAILSVAKSFKGLEHRIEHVATKNGVAYYDDSFSTTPETAIAAIEAFEEPKIIILGGSSKNSDFSELGKVISESDSIRAIIGIGVEWERIKSAIYRTGVQYIEGANSMKDIVQQAQEVGTVGDVVILSPACASFDMFKSYKDRGEQFKKEVQAL